MENYELTRVVGRGTFGSVYLCRDRRDARHYVLKRIDLEVTSAKERQQAEQEVELLRRMQHPNIVSYHDSFFDRSTLCIVMSYCENGDLYHRIQAQKGVLLSEEQIVEWFVQMCLAVKYIHDRRILHRDLKTQNIFLTSNNVVKLGDFGVSKLLSDQSIQARTMIGTPYYLSPEIWQNKPYDYKSDIWSLGCVLYEMTTLHHAFDATDVCALVVKIIKGTYPPIAEQYSAELGTLIRDLLVKETALRPSINEILQRPIIRRGMVAFVERQAQLGRTIRREAAASSGSGGGTGSAKKDKFELELDNMRRELEREKAEQARIQRLLSEVSARSERDIKVLKEKRLRKIQEANEARLRAKEMHDEKVLRATEEVKRLRQKSGNSTPLPPNSGTLGNNEPEPFFELPGLKLKGAPAGMTPRSDVSSPTSNGSRKGDVSVQSCPTSVMKPSSAKSRPSSAFHSGSTAGSAARLAPDVVRPATNLGLVSDFAGFGVSAKRSTLHNSPLPSPRYKVTPPALARTRRPSTSSASRTNASSASSFKAPEPVVSRAVRQQRTASAPALVASPERAERLPVEVVTHEAKPSRAVPEIDVPPPLPPPPPPPSSSANEADVVDDDIVLDSDSDGPLTARDLDRYAQELEAHHARIAVIEQSIAESEDKRIREEQSEAAANDIVSIVSVYNSQVSGRAGSQEHVGVRGGGRDADADDVDDADAGNGANISAEDGLSKAARRRPRPVDVSLTVSNSSDDDDRGGDDDDDAVADSVSPKSVASLFSERRVVLRRYCVDRLGEAGFEQLLSFLRVRTPSVQTAAQRLELKKSVHETFGDAGLLCAPIVNELVLFEDM